jgi:hypothetical protein
VGATGAGPKLSAASQAKAAAQILWKISPFNSILERVARCWHSNAYFSLFSSLFFFDFHRTNFSSFPRTFHSFDPVGFAIYSLKSAQ